MIRLILFLFASTAYSAVTDVNVQGTTSTQAIISYTAPTTAACTVEVSRESDYSPVVEDVNGTYYSGADSDNRTGNIYQGRSRIVVIGKRGAAAIAEAADGHPRSRALWADTEHYFRITCGGDTATGTFRTGNIPVGDTRGDPLPAAAPYQYAAVTHSPAAYPEFADPFTGARIRRADAEYGKFGYAGSSAAWPDTGLPADCNKTLVTPAVKGSCIFTDATGTNWSASDTGTLTAAIRTDDGVFAEYSGTAQEVLYIRMGPGKLARSSSSEQVGSMSFQNFILKLKTSSAAGDGGQVSLCITYDGIECYSPWQTHTLSDTSEATVRWCLDVPCTTAEAPGDLMLSRSPQGYKFWKNVKMYNESGTETTLKFTGSEATAFCNQVYVNEYLYGMTSGLTVDGNYVTAKSCGSSPPQVTVSAGRNYTHNGSSGVGVYTLEYDLTNNPRFGILVRKESTTSGSTISVGYALWRYAVNTPIALAYGAGGFGKRCQIIPTAQGEYLCQFAQQIVGIKYAADGSLQMSNYGYGYVNGNYLNANLVSTGKHSPWGGYSLNDSLWSDSEPGVIYAYLPSNYNNPATSTVDNRDVLVKFEIDTTAELADGDPDASNGTGPGISNKAQRVAYVSTSILTPCLSPCTATTDDFTPYGQRKRYNSGWTTQFNSCRIDSVQGDRVFEICFSGSQDTQGWLFSYDLGNGLPIGGGFVGSNGNTQQLDAGFFVGACQASRWCAMHTFQAPMKLGGAEYTVVEVSTKCQLEVTATTSLSSCSASSAPGTCSACPSVTLDGYDYTGKNWCSNLTVSSTCGFADCTGHVSGDPVAQTPCGDAPNTHYFGQQLAVGDYLTHGSEIVRIIRKNSNTDYDVIRGWGSACSTCSSASSYAAIAHNNSVSWSTRCGTIIGNPTTTVPEFAEAIAWWPLLDPDGNNNDYTYRDTYQNHAFHVNGIAVKPEYQVGTFDSTSASSLKSPTNITSYLPWLFAGRASGAASGDTINHRSPSTSCSGNGCERHPAYGQLQGAPQTQTSYVDVHPRLSHISGEQRASLASGKTYIRKWTGDRVEYFRHFDYESYTGLWPFQRVDTLTDTTADSGKFCIAIVANDCFSGSEADTAYVVYPEFDTRWNGAGLNTCRNAEFGSGQNDICIGPPDAIGAAAAQWRIPSGTSYNGQAQRVVTKLGRTYRESATENMKIDPLGKVLLSRGNWYVIPPPFPGVSSKSGETFQGIPVTVTSVPAGTDNALVQFGYDHEFHCSMNRDNTCYAESATLNQTTPYRFDHETLTGVSCSSGCTITIPAIMNRVVYWRMVYRNSGGTVIARGATQAQAVQ